MAYPWALGHGADASRWIERLGRRTLTRWTAARSAVARGPWPAPTPVLKFQTYDWNADRWIPAAKLAAMVAASRRAGLVNVGLYPVTPDTGDYSARIFDRTATAAMAAGDQGP
jgi:hypothetical protein